jgi:hypothetical protein
MKLFTWIKGLGRRGSNAPLSFDEWLATPPPKIAAAINRHLDRKIARRRGSNPPAPGNKPAAPAEMPSDELMERWRDAAITEADAGGEPTWRTAALLAFVEGRRQAQSLQIPPPGADPVATDEDLIVVATGPVWSHHASRALYARGRADERTAIFRALGVQP